MNAKEIFIIKGTAGESYSEFSRRMFELVESLRGSEGIRRLKIVLTETAPPKLSVIPFRKDKVAVISLEADNPVTGLSLEKVDGFTGIYSVVEAVPVAYDPYWEPGRVTPGVCLLTLFHSRPDITYETFIDRWHNSHTPLSLKLHPLWNYNRNVVKELLSNGSFPYDGIVEEQFRTRRELLNPFIFFGPFWKVPLHMLQVWLDTKSFIDYKRIETYLANEYLVTR